MFTGILALYTLLSLSACQNDAPAKQGNDSAYKTTANGQKIYLQYCKLCHGVNGSLALNGAANLQESALSKDETVRIIAEGRNTMQPYKEILSEHERNAVAEYVMKLRN